MYAWPWRGSTAPAQLRQSRAGLLPSFDLPGSASRQWIENDQDAEPGSPLAEFIPDDDPIAFDSWELALQATWELDLFGATRARRDSAAQQLRSAEAQTVAARRPWPPTPRRAICNCARCRDSAPCWWKASRWPANWSASPGCCFMPAR